MLKELHKIWNYRELLLQLILRELKVRYKQTFLGALWAVLQPLSMMLIFTFVFSSVLKASTPGNAPYPVFSYIGLLPWTFFSSGFFLAVSSLPGNANLISKVYFPRELLPLATIFVALVDFLIAALILVGLLFYYHIVPALNWLWIFPLFILQFFFTLGVSLLLSPLNVKYRDIRYVIPLLLQLWLFMTPVFYSTHLIPKALYPFYMLNPMAFFIEAYHKVMLTGESPFTPYFYIILGETLFIFFFGYYYFKKSERWLAEVI